MRYRTTKNSPIKIQIVEIFLNSNENSSISIARRLGISTYIVSECLTEYLEHKTITIQSKL